MSGIPEQPSRLLRYRRIRSATVVGLIACLALAAGLLTGSGSSSGGSPAGDVSAGSPAADGLADATSTQPAASLVPPPSAGLGPGALAGQRTIVGFPGTAIPSEVSRGIRQGRIGGVILFEDNIPSRAAVRRLTSRLQGISRPKGLRAYPLLIMTDQEGGLVKRLSGAPTASAAEMGRRGPAFARRQGRLTGKNLRNAGINVNAAPVLDVARPGGNIAATDRGFGSTVRGVVRTAIPFATALEANGTAATAKHFPGLGSVRLNTDDAVQRIRLSKAALRKVDEATFRPFIRSGGDMVMVGTAIYPAFGGKPAAFEKRIVTGELRRRLGFRGVTITDALGTVAARAFGGPRRLTPAAARAGMDLMLFTDYTSALRGQDSMADRMRNGRLQNAAFRASVDRILRLRARLARLAR
jgi:beta-N-acetylhexosaminidase